MKLGVILPHTKLYGGVKRFLELGNLFIASGHTFCVYSEEGIAPDWFPFKGETKPFAALEREPPDVLFCVEIRYTDLFLRATAKHKIFYHIRLNEKMEKILKYPEIEIFACSSNAYEYDRKKYGITPFKAFGGIGYANYQAKTSYAIPTDRPVCIMAYGRLERSKGTMQVVRACEILYKKGYNIKLLLFDTPSNEKNNRRLARFKANVPYEYVLNHPFEKNSELFNRADIFVSAERKNAGWSNTVAEAMACALPVVATSYGTKDLMIDGVTALHTYKYPFFIWRKIRKLIEDETLRKQLGENARKHVAQFDWQILARKIEKHLEEQLQSSE